MSINLGILNLDIQFIYKKSTKFKCQRYKLLKAHHIFHLTIFYTIDIIVENLERERG